MVLWMKSGLHAASSLNAGPFLRVPDYVWDLRRDPNVKNYPFDGRMQGLR